METYIKDKITATGTAEKSWKSSQGDILDLALTDPDYGSEASTSELVDQLKTFFFAGHDTTASTISWSYYFLSHNPSALASLRAELDAVFGAGTSPADVAKQLNSDSKLHTKLDYTLSVIKESLRLEPPAAPAREAPANYSIHTSTGFTIVPPQGTMVYISAWMLHRNPRVWGEDSNEYRPERFMSGNPIPWGYLAFSKRPRDCIGSTLAYLEAKIILALTARHFDFEPTIKFYRVLKGTVWTFLMGTDVSKNRVRKRR
jgi:cytochrome P450